MQIAQRMSRIGTETAFEVLVRARELEAQGRHIIHLEIGEPDFPTPGHIVAEAQRALEQGWTHYGPTQGYAELREAVAAYIGRTRGIRAGPDQVSITPGGKPIMFFVMLALIEPGDEVIYPNPGFPIYESMIRFVGAVPVPIRLVEGRGFALDLDQLEDSLTPKTRLLILNSPHNPTGGVLSREDLQAIADLVEDRDMMVLSDEIYSRIHYEDPPLSIAAVAGMQEKTIILDGFSKTYAMTGWRLGFGVMPVRLVEAVSKLMVNSNSCTASFTQRAGIAALTGPQDVVSHMVAEFRRRRDAFCDGLNQLPGMSCARPGGAFYAFPNIEGTGLTSQELADGLLLQAGVACLDGMSFGSGGRGHVRFSYASSQPNLMEALQRIERFLEGAATRRRPSRLGPVLRPSFGAG